MTAGVVGGVSCGCNVRVNSRYKVPWENIQRQETLVTAKGFLTAVEWFLVTVAVDMVVYLFRGDNSGELMKELSILSCVVYIRFHLSWAYYLEI